MTPFAITVTTPLAFEDAVLAVEAKTAAMGFRVLHVHDVAATLSEKGFPCEPLKIVEICNAKYASQILEKDRELALLLPCPISVYKKTGSTYISALLPSSIAEMYPQAGIEEVANLVEQAIRTIVTQAATP